VIGALVVASLSRSGGKVKMFFIRPKLRLVNNEVDSQYNIASTRSAKPLTVYLAKVRVVNIGHDNAGHCQINCSFDNADYSLY